MITLTQVVLVLVISILTTLLVVIGIQVVKILQEMRLGMQKMNRILDDAANLTHAVTQPVASLSGMVEGLKGGVKLVGLVKRILGHEEDDDETVEEYPQRTETGYHE